MTPKKKERILILLLLLVFAACVVRYGMRLSEIAQENRGDMTQVALFALLSMIALLRIYKRKTLGKPIYELKQRRFVKMPIPTLILMGVWAFYAVLLILNQIEVVFASLVMVGVFSFWIFDHLSGQWAKVGIFEKGVASHESAWTFDEIKSWERHEHTGFLFFNVKKRLFVSNWVAFVVDKKHMKTIEPFIAEHVKKS